jgi:PAS domain S-box-containing protein
MKKDLLYDSDFRTDTQILRSIIDRSVIPSFIINQDHLVLYWNRALEELSRIPAKEVIGTSQHWKAFYSEDRPCMADLLVDGKIEKIPEWYKEKYSESKLIDEAFEATDFFPDLGERGRWIRFTAATIRNKEGVIIGALETLEDITERKGAEEEREKLILELQEAISKIKRLSGLLPICASCKKIRNDQGYWEKIEIYIREHSEAEFSHGVCPECIGKLYPEYFKQKK